MTQVANPEAPTEEKVGSRYKGPIFDGDTHIHELNFDFLKTYLDEKYHAEWLVTRKAGPEGFGMYVGDDRVYNADASEDGLVPPPGMLKEWLSAIATGVDTVGRVPIRKDMYEVAERLKTLDSFGVDGSVLFIGEFVSAIGMIAHKAERLGPEGAHALLHAYNQYLVDEWGLNVDDRIYSTAILTIWDLDWAVAEAKWLIERGLRVVVMPMGPWDGKPPADPYFDPLWQVLNDAGVVVTFHVSEANFMHPLLNLWGEKAMQSRRVGQTAWQWMFSYSEVPVMMTMASFIYWNFFERFPNIKMGSVENGAEWVPRFLYKMDKMRGMTRNGFWPMGQLKERPSTIFKRHCFAVAYPEDKIKEIVDQIGTTECLLMGSDYPHAEGVPTPRDFVEEGCDGLTDKQIEEIMYTNGRRIFPRTRS